MYRNLRRRLSIHERRNRILLSVVIILLTCIYLTIDSMGKYDYERNASLIDPLEITVCPQLTSSSKGYFRVNFVENPVLNYSSVCHANDILLIYILSTAQNVQRRQSIRRTWANKKNYQQLSKTCIIFLTGLSNDDSKSSHHHDIKREASVYGDIIQINLNETYQNVVYKEVAALKWSHIYASHIPFLFKTDDDLVIDSLLLSDIVQFFIDNQTNHSPYLHQHPGMKDFVQQMLSVDKYTLFKGSDIGGIPTMRSGKFRIHQLAWNHPKLPPYCSGFGFLYSSFIRDRLYRASLCYATEYVPLVGDLFVSGFLAGAASVRCSGWSLMSMQTGDSCATLYHQYPRVLMCSTPLHKGRQIFSDFDTAWHVIVQRHSVISNPTTTTIPTITTIITTTTMIEKNSLLKKDEIILNKATGNWTKKEEFLHKNLHKQKEKIVSEKSSNQTNSIHNPIEHKKH